MVKTKILIESWEAKEALAILAHIRRIFLTISHDHGWLLPTSMDQPDLLLCAASLRCLLFDESPLLTGFLARHGLIAKAESLETDANLVLTSRIEADDYSLADGFASLMLDAEFRDKTPFDRESSLIVFLRASGGFDRLWKKRQLWRVNEALAPYSRVSHQASNVGDGLLQYLSVLRRVEDLDRWGDRRVGFLGAIPVTRRALVSYVANQLGGVHYQSAKLLPAGSEDREVFPAMVRLLDWQDQSVVHGFIACVGWLCLELMRSQEIADVLVALQVFHHERRRRLLGLEGPIT